MHQYLGVETYQGCHGIYQDYTMIYYDFKKDITGLHQNQDGYKYMTHESTRTHHDAHGTYIDDVREYQDS